MKKESIIGLLLIFVGIGLYIYYDNTIKPEREAKELLIEGKLFFERGSKESVNNSINMFSRVIARYPMTKAAVESYYFIGQSYEKLGLNRLAYFKYSYILKTNPHLKKLLHNEIQTRMAHLNIKKNRTEEGVHQLLGMLNNSNNPDFRSRVYTELGHTYLKTRNYGKSKKMFEIALTENGANEEAIIGKARAYKRMGQDTKAFNLYEKFLSYYGDYSNYSNDIRNAYLREVYNSGYSQFRKGRYYNAIAYFRRLIRYFPYSNKTENSLYWIGESFYAMKKYDSANQYFNRVLTNSLYQKDQDARIKKGYGYFMSKRFDLASREFQIYIDSYPGGKHIANAKKWKEMSTKEIMYRISDKTFDKNEKMDKELDIDDEDKDDEESSDDTEDKDENKGASDDISKDKYENVAEL